MISTSEKRIVQEFSIEQLLKKRIANIKFKAMFGSVGVFKSKSMVGIISNGVFYAKRNEFSLEYLQEKSFPLLNSDNSFLRGYIYVDRSLLDSDCCVEFISGVERSEPESQSNYELLMSLPNMRHSLVNILSSIEIKSVEEFRELGTIGVIKRIADSRPRINFTFKQFMLLEGAVLGIHYSFLSDERKKKLRTVYDDVYIFNV